jgi:hypothetical protein
VHERLALCRLEAALPVDEGDHDARAQGDQERRGGEAERRDG